MLYHNLRRTRRGAAAIEYVVLLSLITGSITVGVIMMGTSARDRFALTPDANSGSDNTGTPSPSQPSEGSGSSGGDSTGSGSGNSSATSFHPLHDNFDGKGNDNMQWQDVGGQWTTGNGERSSSDPKSATIAPVGSADYTYMATVQTQSSTGSNAADTTRVLFRYQDTQNYYAVVTRKDGVVELAKMQNGQWRPALAYANAGTNPYNANQYQVRVAGSAIEVKVNGHTVMRYTDPNPVSTGGVGVGNESSTGRITKASVTPNNGG